MVETKNLTPHILDLEKDFLGPERKRDIDLTEEDKKKFAGKIEYDSQEERTENTKEEKEPKILNEATIDNYLDKNRRVVIKDMNEDKEKLSEKDLNLIIKYESEHKKRQKIIEKAKEMLKELKTKKSEVFE